MNTWFLTATVQMRTKSKWVRVSEGAVVEDPLVVRMKVQIGEPILFMFLSELAQLDGELREGLVLWKDTTSDVAAHEEEIVSYENQTGKTKGNVW